MARVNNQQAVEEIRARRVFDNNNSTLQGRRTFDGWGDVPEKHRPQGGDEWVEENVDYWVYSYDTPIAWVYKPGTHGVAAGTVHMPPVRYSLTTTQHQHLVADALGYPFAATESLMKKGGNYGAREGGW